MQEREKRREKVERVKKRKRDGGERVRGEERANDRKNLSG